MIQVHDRLPEATLYARGPQGLDGVSTHELTADRRIVLFALPGAFTPTCTQEHLPGFMREAATLRALKVDEIVCVAVNDPFVLKFWGEQMAVQDSLRLLSDGNATFTRAVGMERDMSSAAMGLRSKRYAMVVEDGVVRWLGVDDSGLARASVESVIAALRT